MSVQNRIKLLAWIHVAISGGILAFGILVLIDGALTGATAYALSFIGGLLFWISVIVLIPSLAAGLGLLFKQRWAHLAMILVSFEWLLLIPVGTVIGIFGLLTLLRSAPAAPVRIDRNVLQGKSGVLFAMLGVGVGFALIIGIGFLVFGNSGGRALELTLVHKAAIVIVTLALTLYFARPRAPGQPVISVPAFVPGVKPGPVQHIRAMAASPDGKLVAVAAGQQNESPEIRIYNVSTGTVVRRFSSPDVVSALVWSPDGTIVFAGRGELWTGGPAPLGPSLFAFDSSSGRELRRFGDALFGVRSIAVSSDRTMLATCSRLGESRASGSAVDLWDITSGQLIRRLAEQPADRESGYIRFAAVCFSPDGSNVLASCDWDTPGERRGVRMWRLHDGQELDTIPQTTPTPYIVAAGNRILTGGQKVISWDLQEKRKLWEVPSWFLYPIAAAESFVGIGTGYQEDNHGPYVNTGIAVYDARTGARIRQFHLHTPATALTFADGVVAASGTQGEVQFWPLNDV